MSNVKVNPSQSNTNQRPKQFSQGKKTAGITGSTSNSSSQTGSQSRNEKRKRWAKKNRPAAKPVVRRGPVKEYISACCSLPATKPATAEKQMGKDPESGKLKEQRKGLGHWCCSGCGKPAKVTPRTPVKTVAVEVPVVAAS
jgi:hypothetical protein